MNSLDPSLQSKANEAAILCTLIYLPHVGAADSSVEAIVAQLERTPGLDDDQLRQLRVVKAAIDKNPHLADMKIGNQSWMMNPPYEKGGLEVCTFEDTNGNITVVYRGTGKGEWMDNGYGMSGVETEQQIEAMEYFNRVVEENGYAFKDITIDITGHSKGGNKSQYTTINSKYNYLIDNCYNFDGQGMSPEAIAEFKRRYGEEAYNEAVEKMYGFYAENDFVNPLGIPVVPEGHRFYFESQLTEGAEDFAKNHYPDNYLKDDGTFSSQTEQGEISKMIQSLSDEIMDLPPEERSEVAGTIMAFMQLFYAGGDPVNGKKIPWLDIPEGLDIAIPLILEKLCTPEGYKLIIQALGLKDTWYTALGVAVVAVIALPIVAGVYLVIKAIALLEKAVERIIEFGKAVAEAAKKLIENIKNLINGLKSWWNEHFNEGYRYAKSHPYIRVNTDKLRTYADRLTMINRKLRNLDERLDAFRGKVGLIDEGALRLADWTIGENGDLKECIRYLNDTASDLENVEIRILGKMIRV